MGVSPRIFESHGAEVMRKLGARNTAVPLGRDDNELLRAARLSTKRLTLQNVRGRLYYRKDLIL